MILKRLRRSFHTGLFSVLSLPMKLGSGTRAWRKLCPMAHILSPNHFTAHSERNPRQAESFGWLIRNGSRLSRRQDGKTPNQVCYTCVAK